MAPQPSTWCGRSEQISLDQVGCEARTIPAEGDVFFLDFSFYRTNQELAEKQLTCGEQIYQQLSGRGAEITSREWANSEALSCQDFLERSGNADQPSFSLSGRLTSLLPH